MGAAIKNEKVTPRGTPAVTNPINNGTAEQEQNGVTIPKRAAITLPANSLFPERKARVFSGVKKLLMIPTPKTTRNNSIITLGVSYKKNSTEEPR